MTYPYTPDPRTGGGAEDNSPEGLARRAAALGLPAQPPVQPAATGPSTPTYAAGYDDEYGSEYDGGYDSDPVAGDDSWEDATAARRAGYPAPADDPELAALLVTPTAAGAPAGTAASDVGQVGSNLAAAVLADDEFDEPAWRGQAPVPVVLPVWELLSKEEERLQLNQLWQWVRWLVNRHGLKRKIKPCWAQHGPAVEMLTALHQRWLEVYLQPWGDRAEGMGDGRAHVGHDALVWMDQLDTRVRRLEEVFTGCAGEHEDDGLVETWEELEEYYDKLAQTIHPPVVG